MVVSGPGRWCLPINGYWYEPHSFLTVDRVLTNLGMFLIHLFEFSGSPSAFSYTFLLALDYVSAGAIEDVSSPVILIVSTGITCSRSQVSCALRLFGWMIRVVSPVRFRSYDSSPLNPWRHRAPLIAH